MNRYNDKFKRGLTFVKGTNNSHVCYEGIERQYFPKWKGWEVLDNNKLTSDVLETLDLLVDSFYYDYFWVKLKCGDMNSTAISSLIFTFAVLSGKKKAVSKLQRVLGVKITGVMDSNTINELNSRDPERVFLRLYAECLEMYIGGTSNSVSNTKKLLQVYYYWDNIK